MKKILISLFAINVAVLTLVFSMIPNETKALPDYQWDGLLLPCIGSVPPMDWNYCDLGNTLPYCVDGPCGITLPIVVVK